MQFTCKWKFIAQSCPTLCDPVDCSLPNSSFHGILQAREYWGGLPFPSPGDLPDPGIEHGLLHSRRILHQLSHQGNNSFSTAKYSYAKLNYFMDFPGGCQCRRSRKEGLISESEKSPGEGNDNPFQYSCLENSMDRGAWQATIQCPKKPDTTKQLRTLGFLLTVFLKYEEYLLCFQKQTGMHPICLKSYRLT